MERLVINMVIVFCFEDCGLGKRIFCISRLVGCGDCGFGDGEGGGVYASNVMEAVLDKTWQPCSKLT